MDYESLGFPNVVRDAYVQYAFTKHFSAGIGQTEASRKAVSGSFLPATNSLWIALLLTPPSTSTVISACSSFIRKRNIHFVARSPRVKDETLLPPITDWRIPVALTILPFGAFTNGGDYFEGDLAREKTPKLSIGLAYSHNENASRTAGQLGKYALHTYGH